MLRIIDAIHREKDIDREALFEGIELALLTAARRQYGMEGELNVKIDRETGNLAAYQETPEGQVEIPLDLGRIAAQTAKQVIIQKIREAERDVVFDEYQSRLHTIVTGSVQRFEGGTIIANLGRTEAILPKTEQVRGENYRVGDRIRAYVMDIKKLGQKVKIVLSRSHPDFIRKLFELEVPELAEGLIEVKTLVREAGYKTKMAVQSLDGKVDGIGACVGVRGTRLKNVIDELNGEKIDVIRWSDQSDELIGNALKPAQVNAIALDPENMRAKVVVDDDQLSLAIGRRGQNVRLAAKLCKWDISIVTESEFQEGDPQVDESTERIGRFDDDMELGGAGLTPSPEFESETEES
ncbi:MAG: transcription termination factor NusA [Planctomycetota bacterium]|nr:transcription termination factor NusA [Planctomycetota bacterium]